MNSSPVVIIVLLLISLFLGLHARDTPNALNVEYTTSPDSFSDVYPDIYSHLTSHTANPPSSISGRLFLAPRRPDFIKLPRVFVMLNMTSNVRQEEATMAFCLDDMYSWGFKTRSGDWYSSMNFEKIVADSSLLRFGHSYQSFEKNEEEGHQQ